MWILKNSTNLLSSLGHLGVHKATSIQTFDFSTLYTSISHDLLKSCMNNIINNAFKHKNGATRYTHIKVGRNKSHFTSDPLNGDNKYTANDICKMIEFLVDNIYVRFGGQLSRQMVGIPWKKTQFVTGLRKLVLSLHKVFIGFASLFLKSLHRFAQACASLQIFCKPSQTHVYSVASLHTVCTEFARILIICSSIQIRYFEISTFKNF